MFRLLPLSGLLLLGNTHLFSCSLYSMRDRTNTVGVTHSHVYLYGPDSHCYTSVHLWSASHTHTFYTHFHITSCPRRFILFPKFNQMCFTKLKILLWKDPIHSLTVRALSPPSDVSLCSRWKWKCHKNRLVVVLFAGVGLQPGPMQGSDLGD